jgi:hypothetical protein
MKLFSDIGSFLGSLTFVDYVFFFAVIILLILVVTLLYFIKINDNVFDDNKKSETKTEITLPTEQPEKQEIASINTYEKEQEEKAIISYDELIKKNKINQINYDDEEDLGDIKVKKISLDPGLNNTTPDTQIKVQVISYAKEEAFLESLKNLQTLLN